MQESDRRYSNVSIAIHWAVVVLVLTNVWLGGRMTEAEGAAQARLLSAHASVGISILVLTLARLGWRLAHPWPRIPDGTPGWQRVIARATHVSFYALLVAAPLFGWATVSAYPGLTLEVFGGLPWPKLPLAQSESLSGALGETHKTIVKTVYVVLALHIAGALKHHILQRDQVLHRMLPLVPQRRPKT
jgi:cytochrome b561